MMLTVNRLHSMGLRHFAMVHDSYGVHASDVDLLNRVLREEFVRIYSEPVMWNFFKDLWKNNPGAAIPALQSRRCNPRPAPARNARHPASP
jgi:DNA-directed RNA polymerase, mitochondrial